LAAGSALSLAGSPNSDAAAAGAAPKNILPRWRGANLLEKFYSDQSGKRPSRPFVERDFEWLARWGFDFVRLPMDYRFWTDLPDRRKFKESVLKEIDQAVEWGRQYKIHVNINFHRAPGYCVNRPELEPFNLWSDEEAQEVCELHWVTFAKRYKNVSSKHLSFNLWNEPGALGRRGLTRKGLEKLVRRIVGAIRRENPDRLVIADGPSWGKIAMPELADLKIGQSTRAYAPSKLTHYKASWVNSKGWPEPTWPLQDGNTRWDIDKLREHYRPWLELIRQGVGVHCGEGGVYRYTPHKVALGFLRDVLTVLKEYNIGWAIWNMRGNFGWIDSRRDDVKYEDFEGHKLDRAMLELLQQF
jgi:endoglucanase